MATIRFPWMLQRRACFIWLSLLLQHSHLAADLGRCTATDLQTAKKGPTPSQSDVILGIHLVISNKILRILKPKGFTPDLPKNLYNLIKKRAAQKHSESNKKVKDGSDRSEVTKCLHTIRSTGSSPTQLETQTIYNFFPGSINLFMSSSNEITIKQ